MRSIRFVTACYIVSFVACHHDERPSTATIARWVNAHPSRVRQIVARLVRGGLLKAHRGGNGGIELARPAHDISLLDIFDALGDEVIEPFAVEDPFSQWKDVCRVHDTLTRLQVDLEAGIRERLAAIRVTALYQARAAGRLGAGGSREAEATILAASFDSGAEVDAVCKRQ